MRNLTIHTVYTDADANANPNPNIIDLVDTVLDDNCQMPAEYCGD